MIIDLQDDRRAAKTWLPHPGDDRDVTNELVTEESDGKPRCWRHGAMNRAGPVRRTYRCSEFRCGVGAEVVPDSGGAWNAFWAEVEAAVGKGAPSILLGASTPVAEEEPRETAGSAGTRRAGTAGLILDGQAARAERTRSDCPLNAGAEPMPPLVPPTRTCPDCHGRGVYDTGSQCQTCLGTGGVPPPQRP